MSAIGAGLAIGLTGFAAGYGEGKFVASSLDAINRNPENKNQVLQFMVLFIALIEVVAIYGLIIALKLLK
ncbi:MAG: ATP synthase F0 subunit C [Candidatus Peribacteria bacterium]|nr:MAG: ATP synthase F0 subunit C [Candidatus Peribacteria bacterium]